MTEISLHRPLYLSPDVLFLNLPSNWPLIIISFYPWGRHYGKITSYRPPVTRSNYMENNSKPTWSHKRTHVIKTLKFISFKVSEITDITTSKLLKHNNHALFVRTYIKYVYEYKCGARTKRICHNHLSDIPFPRLISCFGAHPTSRLLFRINRIIFVPVLLKATLMYCGNKRITHFIEEHKIYVFSCFVSYILQSYLSDRIQNVKICMSNLHTLRMTKKIKWRNCCLFLYSLVLAGFPSEFYSQIRKWIVLCLTYF